jgi:aminopeptidase YwaD
MTGNTVDGNRALGLLQCLGSGRVAGSQAELAAAHLLMDEIRTTGLEPQQETFLVHTVEEASATLDVLSPYQASISCQAVSFSGETAIGGLEAPLVYVEGATPQHLRRIRDSIALVSVFFGRLDEHRYEQLVRHGALGFVCIGEPAKREAVRSMLEFECVERWGRRPGVFVAFDDGLRLVREHAEYVRLTVRQVEQEAQSSNVVAEVRGTECPDEVILIGAHYDTHRDIDGAHDNGAGTVAAMELLRYFVVHPPRRTLRFVWFGSEEMGMVGSYAYANRHSAELSEVTLMLNLDMGGGILGQDTVSISGPPELRTFFELLNSEKGLGLSIDEQTYGGDPVPFLEAGIPTATVYRWSGTASFAHSVDDCLALVDGPHLAWLAEIGLALLAPAANAYSSLFRRELPEEVRLDLRRRRERRARLAPKSVPSAKGGAMD